MKLTPRPSRPSISVRKAKRAPTTETGYTNPNRQVVVSAVGAPSTTHPNQRVYRLRCERHGCGNEYGSNGADIHLRKCPKCQGGAPGEPLREALPMLAFLD